MGFVAVLASLLAVANVAAAKAPRPYVVPDTEVLDFHSNETGADYLLYVARPSAPPADGAAYPVVYMLDADYSFTIVRNIIQHFIERGNLPPMVLVAIAYPGGASDPEIYRTSRTRDYTPTFVAEGGYGAKYQKVSGGAPKFLDFIETELAPMIEERYGAGKDRTIIGHSYGGLLGAYALVTRPDLFSRYVIVSPSLWHDDRLVLKLEEAQAARDEKLEERVFLSVGALENEQMSGDLEALHARLVARQDPGLFVDIQIYPDETHNSVFPGAVTRGLLKVFDAFPARSPARIPAPSNR